MVEIKEKLDLLDKELTNLKTEVKRTNSRLDHISMNISLIAERLSRPKILPIILTTIALIGIVIIIVI